MEDVAAAEVAEVAAVTDRYFGNCNRLVLQFHITGRCNLSCKHCYRTEGDVETLSADDIFRVLEQFKELRKKYCHIHSMKKRGHVNITGGEPFYRNDIKDILRYFGENKDTLTYGVLSNGSFIDGEIISLLKETEVSFVQLSIDGDKNTHDGLRAKGDYERVLKKAETLEKNGIRTYISFTANKGNYKFLPKVAAECRKRGVTKLWSDRLVPIGNGQGLEDLKITENELTDYIRTLKKAGGGFVKRLFFPKTQVAMNRALQFLESKGGIYSCSAGDSLITVDEFGRIMPCRRRPIICGDVFSSSLEGVYFNDPTFRELRKKTIPQECGECFYKLLCRGGAKCQSYAVYGSYKKADPACPLKKRGEKEDK